jgi:hypothetical protein
MYAGNGLEQGALAGAVRAENGHELAFRGFDVDGLEHRQFAVAGMEAADLEHYATPR